MANDPRQDLVAGSEVDAHHGHRKRLRERIYRGDNSLLDHEPVEYLLALHNRRGDTKRRAKELLDQFGGIGGLLGAPPEVLRREGVSPAQLGALKIAELTARRLLEAKVAEQPVISDGQSLLDYLKVAMAHRQTEEVRVLFLDAKNRLISNDAMWTGTIDESAIHVREIVKRALDLQAAALILVHNHPSGDPTPSRQDIRLTQELLAAARPLKLSVHDHLVIGGDGHASLRAQGHL
ncbi:RadC family protein [Sphingomicrobium clamense]|uniref:DNA repair protein RadC n=1 Tax=Sphingomicrobium clamense TaxID=2851013 RepID=A0ABS6V5C7_9SPHN|nr:DNA repair protein RadC [Sphingomicrobium sp. B8]MBW0144701.1 DNA repair protein RadC [Sphingomicrobium sp. B8]